MIVFEWRTSIFIFGLDSSSDVELSAVWWFSLAFSLSSCELIIWGVQSIFDKCGWEFPSGDNVIALSGSINELLSDGSKWRIGWILGVLYKQQRINQSIYFIWLTHTTFSSINTASPASPNCMYKSSTGTSLIVI